MKKIQDNYGYIIVFALIFTIGAVMALPNVLAEENTDTLYYIGPNTDGHGHLFLQPSSEYENVILVSLSDLNDWDISVSNEDIGEEYTATFTDHTLWEVESIKQD